MFKLVMLGGFLLTTAQRVRKLRAKELDSRHGGHLRIQT
jgi:hypothetical protein